MHDLYTSVFLFGLVIWPTRLIFLAMGEVPCSGFNLVVSSPSDRRGSEARICTVAIKDKKVGFVPY